MEWFTVFIFLFTIVGDTGGNLNTTQSSCISAHAPIDSNVVRSHCFPYFFPNGYCKHVFGNTLLFADRSIQESKEKRLQLFENGRKMLEAFHINVSIPCLRIVYPGYCQWYFPKCDLTSSQPMGRRICRESCDYFTRICAKEFEMAMKIKESGYPIYWHVINCTNYKYRNGGDNPECFYFEELNTETDKLRDKECYYGNGLGYRGSVNVTRSGHACQSWSSQCPHRHDHSLAKYPELVNASNCCRNPGGQAPHGPWCYTTDKNTRWQYCNVKKCPDPAPTRSPDVVRAFSTGPYKIIIEWRPIPLPFAHGKPVGFRIRATKVGEDDPIINTTSMVTNYFEVENLQPFTNYSVSVLEFNKNGDGPLSVPVYVETMPQNFVAVRFTLHLENEKYSPTLLKRNSTRYKTLERTVKSQLNGIFKNTKSDKYNIYQINVIRFFQGSVGVEFDITAELINTTSWAATQSITGNILKKSNVLSYSSLSVKASPPPPVNLSQSDVTRTSVAISWSAPVHHGIFSITNFTIQYKKAGTSMSYYNAMLVGADERALNVENLDSNTNYLVRVASINPYGSQPSEPMAVTTKAAILPKTPITAILVPVVVMAIILVVVGLLFLRWWRKKKKEERHLKERIQTLSENPYESAVDWFNLLKIDVIKEWWEIPRDDLTIENKLGSGAFGVVHKGFLKKGEEGKEKHGMYCAVKMLKDNPTECELRDICNEINIMSKIGDHPNIVSLIGACTINGPPLLVVKFAPNGCLLEYIKENRPLPEYENTAHEPPRKAITEKERLKFAYEIAEGMAHLEKYRYVHRDLAARNILLGKNMIALVSDFGMSRDVYEIGQYEKTTGGLLPVRWMAIESLEDYTYTTETDVWSFGVLLWEIESGGIVPYGGLSGIEILQKLKDGYRLEKPTNTSRDLYSIMWKCWNPDPKQRPSFSELAYQIKGLLSCHPGGYDAITSNENEGDDAVTISQNNGYDAVTINQNNGYDEVEIKTRKDESRNDVIEMGKITLIDDNNALTEI